MASFWALSLSAQWVDISEASAPVRGIYADALNSRLYAVGQFRYIGPDSLEARGTAYWEGAQWHEVPNAQVTNGSPSAVSPFLYNIISDADGIIFSGFRVELSGGKSGAVIRYDGDTTLTVLVDSCSGGQCGWVTPLDGELYVTGRFTSLNGSSLNKAVKWNGTNFDQVADVDPVTFSAIEPIVLLNGELYAGGSVYDTVTTHFRGLMRYDGSQWNFLPGGIFGTGFGGVGEMVVYNNELWCGGWWLTQDGNLANNLQIWNGQSWRALTPEVVFTNQVYHLQISDGEMYITGTFRIGGQGPEYHFARTDGQTYFCALGTAPTWAPMRLEKLGNDFYCISGGRVLKNTGALPVDTCVQLSVGIEEVQKNELTVYPNPATGSLTINVPDKWNAGSIVSIELLDLRGASVVLEQYRVEGQAIYLDLNGLASGPYILNASRGREVLRTLVVKE